MLIGVCAVIRSNTVFGPWLGNLSLSTLWTKTDTFANSIDPDEIVHYEPSHHNLQFYIFDMSLFATVDMCKFKDGRVHC